MIDCMVNPAPVFMGLEESVAPAGGGGGGASVPDGYTALLDAESMSAGAFPTTANPGSAGSNWVANHTGITIETAGGPNSRKWAKNPGTAWQDWVQLSGKTLGDHVTATAGMLGFIMKCAAAKTWCGMADNVIRAYVSAPNISMFVDSVSASRTYTADSWRAGVFRWDGTKSYLKLDGDSSWGEGADGTCSSVASAFKIVGDGWAGQSCGVSYFVSYNTQSEAAGDALLTYLTGLLA